MRATFGDGSCAWASHASRTGPRGACGASCGDPWGHGRTGQHGETALDGPDTRQAVLHHRCVRLRPCEREQTVQLAQLVPQPGDFPVPLGTAPIRAPPPRASRWRAPDRIAAEWAKRFRAFVRTVRLAGLGYRRAETALRGHGAPLPRRDHGRLAWRLRARFALRSCRHSSHRNCVASRLQTRQRMCLV